jgi:hypothetical protein
LPVPSSPVRGPEAQGLPGNIPPPTLQSFGHVAVSSAGELTVKLIDITGEVLYEKVFEAPQELPITETDVFIQSGEVSMTSANVMIRCNNEEDSTVTVIYEDGEVSAEATAATDFTVTVKLEGLSSNTVYTYRGECATSSGTTTSIDGTFKTLPDADSEDAMSFVWYVIQAFI